MKKISSKIGWKCFFFLMVGFLGIACWGSAGCCRLQNLRGEGFQDNSMGEAIQEVQPARAKPREFWSFSNKARQIEADFPSN